MQRTKSNRRQKIAKKAEASSDKGWWVAALEEVMVRQGIWQKGHLVENDGIYEKRR